MDPNLISHEANDNFADEDKIDLDDIKGKIFIGGLSWQTSEANLRYYFEKFGELSDVALMIDKRTGKPRGFGFIKMKDPAAADIVMSTEHTIDGRLVDVKRALPRDKAPGPTRSEACKIFVGGLAPEITEKEFGDYFSKFGIVKDAVVMVDRNTGSSRGFGFVTFEVEETVEQVMKIQHEIMGKYVEIKRAEPRDSSRGSVGGYDNGGQTMYGGMGGYGGRMAGGRGPGPMGANSMGAPRYGQHGGAGGPGAAGGMRDAGGMMGGGYGAAPMGAPMNSAYGGYMAQGGMRGAPAGPSAGYGRYPQGYGGAPAAPNVFRPTGGYGGMAAPAAPAGYGYAAPAAMAPQGMAGYYGGATLAPAPAAFAGYGGVGAPQGGAPAGGAAAGYGGAAQYSPSGARPGPFPGSDGGPTDYNGQPVDGRTGQPPLKDGYDSGAIAAGYASAAALQMRAQPQQQPQYPYGGAALAPAGYGAAPAPYGVYGGAVPGAPQGAAPAGARLGPGPPGQEPAAAYGAAGPVAGAGAVDQGGNYGAYRGQGAPQGRVDRSYRPY